MKKGDLCCLVEKKPRWKEHRLGTICRVDRQESLVYVTKLGKDGRVWCYAARRLVKLEVLE
jgi:hypothetical protein